MYGYMKDNHHWLVLLSKISGIVYPFLPQEIQSILYEIEVQRSEARRSTAQQTKWENKT